MISWPTAGTGPGTEVGRSPSSINDTCFSTLGTRSTGRDLPGVRLSLPTVLVLHLHYPQVDLLGGPMSGRA